MSTTPHIAALIEILADTLSDATKGAHAACLVIHSGNRNLAIGELLSLDGQLGNARALYDTVLSLHRRGSRQIRSAGALARQGRSRRTD